MARQMKARVIIQRLQELGCTLARIEGSHYQYRTPCGQIVTVVGKHMNDEASPNVMSSIRRVLKAEGLDFEGRGGGQSDCTMLNRGVAGLAGAEGESRQMSEEEYNQVVKQFSDALGELGPLMLRFASANSDISQKHRSAIYAYLGSIGLVGLLEQYSISIRDLNDLSRTMNWPQEEVAVASELPKIVKILGPPVEVPRITAFGSWAIEQGIAYVWPLPLDDMEKLERVEAQLMKISKRQADPGNQDAAKQLASVIGYVRRTHLDELEYQRKLARRGKPSGWMGLGGLSGFAGEIVDMRKHVRSVKFIENQIEKDRAEWYTSVTTHGSPVWALYGADRLPAVVTVPATVRKDGRLSDYVTVRFEHGELMEVPTNTVASRAAGEARILPFRGPEVLRGLAATRAGGADADYYGEARMALEEEAKYVEERLACMTAAEHLAEAREARRMAEAMARLAMRASDGKTARYMQDRVVFYNRMAADHEQMARSKQ